jgi:hypothetical protein
VSCYDATSMKKRRVVGKFQIGGETLSGEGRGFCVDVALFATCGGESEGRGDEVLLGEKLPVSAASYCQHTVNSYPSGSCKLRNNCSASPYHPKLP